MTLRLRLVIALVALVAVGLAAFGVVTYVLYAHSEYQRLDTQIRSSEPVVEQQLEQAAGLIDEPGLGARGGGPPTPQGPEGGGGPAPLGIAAGSYYAELRSATGTILSYIALSSSNDEPRLPNELPPATIAGAFITVASTQSGQFRVLVAAHHDGGTVIVAVPTTEVTNALRQLTLIETIGAALLLLLLSTGSWFLLRRSLRPLERMAGSARSITAGDLSQRVAPAGGATEVGELGLALNTMLDGIEGAFLEREATETRLRQFLADASHELRTPLTSIQGFAELFRVGRDQADVDLPTILRRIEEESARMKVLVDELLLLARIDQARTASLEPVDLAVLAADACSDAAATEPGRPLTLDAPMPVIVAGDEGHLRQAIANLVTNALRHTSAGTAVEVGARLEDGSAVVTVRDHGEGLRADTLTHLFDRFWQADSARVGTGAGLGLSIVAGIAAEHGGVAEAANATGGGALFTLRLPINGVTVEST